MSDTQNYVEWRPEYDGHAPPYWREWMAWGIEGVVDVRHRNYLPEWHVANRYTVPAEALNIPNDDAKDVRPQDPRRSVHEALAILRGYSAEELAKHGITLAPEKDWATELWADLWEERGSPEDAALVRQGETSIADRSAIALIRERVVLKEGV